MEPTLERALANANFQALGFSNHAMYTYRHTYIHVYIYTCMWGNTCHANESLDESLGNYRQFKKCTYIIMARKNESFVRIWRKSCIIFTV